MVMKMSELDKLIEEIGNPETNSGRMSIIISELRQNYETGVKEVEKLIKTKEDLQSTKEDLQESNVNLFKQVGREVYGFNYGAPKEKPKSFSESIKLSDLEKSIKTY
jgi:endo-alpha-1,4-polygalactosaminidase (GH114 family)